MYSVFSPFEARPLYLPAAEKSSALSLFRLMKKYFAKLSVMITMLITLRLMLIKTMMIINVGDIILSEVVEILYSYVIS
jgi:hypothetical protein